jgi:hypothetical protein
MASNSLSILMCVVKCIDNGVSYGLEELKTEFSLGIVPVEELKTPARIFCISTCKAPLADSAAFPPVYDYTSTVSYTGR